MTFGVNDINLNTLISQLIEIQIKKNVLIDGGQVKNPAIMQYNRQSKQLVLNLQELINTSKTANNFLLSDYKSQILEMERSLRGIPKVEMELLNIERLQSISENIYIFLLQKRAEARITSSSNIADAKILEPAFSFNRGPISPNKNRTYLFALIFGLLVPVIFLLVMELVKV